MLQLHNKFSLLIISICKALGSVDDAIQQQQQHQSRLTYMYVMTDCEYRWAANEAEAMSPNLLRFSNRMVERCM